MYASCGLLIDARKMFGKLSVRDIAWNTIISSYAKYEQDEEVLFFYEDMLAEGASPDSFTFASGVKTCGNLGAFVRGWEVYMLAGKGYKDDGIVCIMMIEMYALPRPFKTSSTDQARINRVSKQSLRCLEFPNSRDEVGLNLYFASQIMEYPAEDTKKRKLDDSNGSTPLLTRDDVRMLLEPLSKEQLVNLLMNAGLQYPAIADEIRDIASKDPAHRKLFVRGLSWETSSETLRDVFEQFGEIEEGAVIVDKATGKSRGFGFITYKHMDSAQRALKEPSKTVDGRITVCNLAVSGTYAPIGVSDQAQRKLFIGGLSYDTTTETLINIFSQYGEIEEGSVAYDKSTNKSRGFAFMTYKSVEAARRALSDPNKNIEGRNVVIKLAMDGLKDKPQVQMVNPQGTLISSMQPGYAVNPNMAPYPRAQLQAGAAPLGAYPASLANAYSGQPSYPTVGGAQYGAGGAAGQFGSAAYSQYGGGYANPQAGQPGMSTLSSVLPGFYSAAP
ncbi:hypothetical protein L7F22_027309 [Adiantum nelumboides]|nr:hypothetical protein [Adiantum nelumboides]